jgi:hypothetical protein
MTTPYRYLQVTHEYLLSHKRRQKVYRLDVRQVKGNIKVLLQAGARASLLDSIQPGGETHTASHDNGCLWLLPLEIGR